MAQVAGTVMDVTGEVLGDAIMVPMETSEKPVTLVNKDAQPLAIQKPAPPTPEPIMTKAAPVNPVTAKMKVDSDQKTDNIQVQMFIQSGATKRQACRCRGGNISGSKCKRKTVTSILINQ